MSHKKIRLQNFFKDYQSSTLLNMDTFPRTDVVKGLQFFSGDLFLLLRGHNALILRTSETKVGLLCKK